MCLQRAQLLPRCHPSSQLQFSIVIIYFLLRDSCDDGNWSEGVTKAQEVENGGVLLELGE